MKKCSNCNAILEDDDLFCPECGTRQSVAAGQNAPLTKEPEKAKRPHGFERKWLWVTVCLVLVVGCGIYFFLSSEDDKPSLLASRYYESQRKDLTGSPENEMILEFYEFVFGKKEMTEAILNKYLTPNVKNTLWTEDQGGGYMIARFRTVTRESNRDFFNISVIEDIISLEDGWFRVEYLDMGFEGKTKLRVEGEKIIDYEPDPSWEYEGE